MVRERKAYGQRPTAKCMKNYGIGKSQFGNHHNRFSGQSSMYAKLWLKSSGSKRIFHSLKVSPHKILTNYKGDNSNIRVEKPGR